MPAIYVEQNRIERFIRLSRQTKVILKSLLAYFFHWAWCNSNSQMQQITKQAISLYLLRKISINRLKLNRTHGSRTLVISRTQSNPMKTINRKKIDWLFQKSLDCCDIDIADVFDAEATTASTMTGRFYSQILSTRCLSKTDWNWPYFGCYPNSFAFYSLYALTVSFISFLLYRRLVLASTHNRRNYHAKRGFK